VAEGLNSRNPVSGLALRLLAATGARRGEVCGLRWSDVDLDRRVIRIRTAFAQLADGTSASTTSGTGSPAPSSTPESHSRRSPPESATTWKPSPRCTHTKGTGVTRQQPRRSAGCSIDSSRGRLSCDDTITR
jgi:hypothetical protein